MAGHTNKHLLNLQISRLWMPHCYAHPTLHST